MNLDSFASSGSNTQAIAAGRSVGYYLLPDFTTRAFMHADTEGTVDLNSVVAPELGWVLSNAKGVNAKGYIAGEGTKNGQPTTFLLAPATTTVQDTTPPVITSLTATPSSLLPKGQRIDVTVAGEATDDSNMMPVCSLTSVTGPGAAGTDFAVTSANTAWVLGVGGRTYSMNVTCVDGSNNAASKSVDVTIPLDTTAPVSPASRRARRASGRRTARSFRSPSPWSRATTSTTSRSAT